MCVSDTGVVSVLIRAVSTISFESEAASQTHDLRGFGPVALGCMYKPLQTSPGISLFKGKFQTTRLGEGFIMTS